MDMMDFVSVVSRLDDGSVLFDEASMFITDRKGKTYLSFDMDRQDYQAISGGILAQAKNVTLKKFTTGENSGKRIKVEAQADLDLTGAYIVVAEQLAKVLSNHDQRAGLCIMINRDPNHGIELYDVAAKNLAIEVSDYLFKFYETRDQLEKLPLGYIHCSIRDGKNITITMKEEFMS